MATEKDPAPAPTGGESGVPSSAAGDAAPTSGRSMHDLISLGEVAAALAPSSPTAAEEEADEEGQALRLPFLLRLLHAAQPLASVPTLRPPPDGESDGKGGAAGRDDDGGKPPDPLRADLDRTVAALESAAAAHPPSEGVEAVSVHLAPEACRRIGRCRPLRRLDDVALLKGRRRGKREDGDDDDDEGGGAAGDGAGGGCEWDEGRLADLTAAASGGSGRKKRRRLDDEDEDDDGGKGGEGSGLDDDDEGVEEQPPPPPPPKDSLHDAVAGIVAAAAASGDDQLAAHKRMVAELLPVYQKMAGAAPAKTTSSGPAPAAASSAKKRRASPGSSSSPGGGGGDYSELSALLRSAKSAEEDSVRSGVGRTLAEVVGLVVAGLRNPPRPPRRKRRHDKDEGSGGDKDDEDDEDQDDDDDNDDEKHSRAVAAALVALPVKSDSILAEPATEDGGRSAAPMGGADLPATVAALMHYAPVLRHEHLANALCRSTVPRGPEIVASLAANCPPAAPSLLRGCVDAHLAASAAVSSSSSSSQSDGGIAPADRAVARSAASSIRRLAALSPSEAWGAATALRDECRFASGSLGSPYAEGAALALDLTLGRDAEAATAMLLGELTRDGRRARRAARVPPSFSGADVEGAGAGEEKKGGAKPGGAAAAAAAGRRLRRGDSRDADDGGADGRDEARPKRPSRGRRKIRPPRRGGRGRFLALPTADASSGGRGMADALSRDPDLASRAEGCVVSCLEDVAGGKGGGAIVWGRAALHARTFAALAHEVGVDVGRALMPSEVGGDGPPPFAERAFRAMERMASGLATSSSDGSSEARPIILPETSPGDDFRRFALCACAVSGARLADASGDVGKSDGGAVLEACLDCLRALLRPSVSGTSDAFASYLAGAVSAGDGSGLGALVREVLFGHDGEEDGDIVFGDTAPSETGDGRSEKVGAFGNLRFIAACSWASSQLDAEVLAAAIQRGWSSAAVVADVRAALAAIARGQMKATEKDSLLKGVLCDPAKSAALFGQQGAVSLIFSSIKTTDDSTDGPPKIPLVLPLQVEALAAKASWNLSDLRPLSGVDGKDSINSKDNPIRCQFVLQLLYVLLFADRVKDSPFAVDPRSLPVGAALLFCRARLHGSAAGRQRNCARSIIGALEGLLARLCPEVLSTTPDGSSLSFEDAASGLSSADPANKVSPTTVAAVVRACLLGGGDVDPSGRRAERLFLKSRSDFPSVVVDAHACAALLSSRHAPPRFRPYSTLCRDPLVLLRCSVGAWRCRGLRRIMLSVLRRLLDANDFIARETVPSESVVAEMLAARDALVARCLLISDSCGYCFDKDSVEGSGAAASAAARCPMAVSLIRSLVSRRRGLTAILVKQGLPDPAVDLLAEVVPETLADAPVLCTLLSERNTLTAAERLTVADASLRIVIAHGAAAADGPNISNDSPEAQKLAYSAMAVLVSSFFLVLGPVGVPVDAVCEEDGRDLTSTCRTATFRMIGAMQWIGCHRSTLKNEAKMALGKIAGLCKSEGAMGGVAGVAGAKRKALLKELWDVTMRSLNALGGGI